MKLLSADLDLHPHSLTEMDSVEYGMVKTPRGDRLAVLGDSSQPEFEGERSELGGAILVLAPLTPKNAAALRSRLTWLCPVPLGLSTSAGMGDRIGLATPGHVRAARSLGGRIAPIFIQQSIREMARTTRTPQQVMDDAAWGIFSEGWRSAHGADADHLKTFEDIDACLKVGYSFFTVDPGAYVDDRAEKASLQELRELSAALPAGISTQASGLLGRTFEIEDIKVTFDEFTLLKAAVKYGRAVLHVSEMYRHLVWASGSRPFEFEVSVDETEQPTSHAEHIYIASELSRLDVKWVSLAPRYVGRFEKGVDYIGDLALFEQDFGGHAAIARHFGPYKLSLHSGSDKFSIYGIAAQKARGLVHLKTAGTSYLEALRTIALVDPGLLKEIYIFARERYEHDRASYHVSAQLKRAPLPSQVGNWPDLLEQFDAREILHVTFGSVLTDRTVTGELRFYDRFMNFLRANSGLYAANLEKHFIRHLKPLDWE